jgi:hypothetical protein
VAKVMLGREESERGGKVGTWFQMHIRRKKFICRQTKKKTKQKILRVVKLSVGSPLCRKTTTFLTSSLSPFFLILRLFSFVRMRATGVCVFSGLLLIALAFGKTSPIQTDSATQSYLPVVIMHGILDSYTTMVRQPSSYGVYLNNNTKI